MLFFLTFDVITILLVFSLKMKFNILTITTKTVILITHSIIIAFPEKIISLNYTQFIIAITVNFQPTHPTKGRIWTENRFRKDE